MHQLITRPKDHIAQLDGIRALASISLIGFHSLVWATITLSTTGDEYSYYRYNPAFNLIAGLTTQVDIFFVLSGFLITKTILSKLSSQQPIEYFQLIKNRALRLWPPLFILIIYELLTNRSDPFLHFIYKPPLFIQNFRAFDNTLDIAHFWSTAVDFQVILVLPLLLISLHKINMLSFRTLVGILILNFFINAISFDDRVNIWTLGQIFHVVSGFSPKYHQYFIDQYSWAPPVSISEYGIGEYQYNTNYANPFIRYAPFIVGSLIAFSLQNPTKTENSKKFLYTTLSCFFIFSCFLPIDPSVAPPYFAQVLLTISFRQLFSICFGFLLYTSLVPKNHAYHNEFLSWFLSWKLWYPFSVLSYTVYIIHWVIVRELAFLTRPETFYFSWIYLLWFLGFVLAETIAAVIYLYIETPFANWRRGKTKKL